MRGMGNATSCLATATRFFWPSEIPLRNDVPMTVSDWLTRPKDPIRAFIWNKRSSFVNDLVVTSQSIASIEECSLPSTGL